MLVAVAGMSHRSAPVEVRERVAFAPCAARSFARRLKEEGVVAETVLLSTCNRTELYTVVEDEGAWERLLDEIAAEKGLDREVLEQHTYWLTDDEAVRHLYQVASSLDSMVVGEAQILGQVREAYRAATEELCAGPILNRLFHTALRVGKKVRSETGIGDNSLSVPRVAVRLAEEVFGTLRGRRALVLGAGEMSGLVVKHLKGGGISEVRIANRTAGRAEEMAERLGGVAVGFEDLGEQLPRVDVVVGSTGSGDWVIGSGIVAEALEEREEPLFFIDIAVPRDVDPVVQNLDRAYLYDVDDLQAIVERNGEDRSAAAAEGETMIGPAVLEFMGWLSTLHVVPLIKELRDGAERIRSHELARALKGLDLSREEAQAVERMSHALVNKLLHGPIGEIKALAESGYPLESVEVRRHLLALEGFLELGRPGDRFPLAVTPTESVVLGTRGSKLALVQAGACAEELRAAGIDVEVRVIKTTSEQLPETPFSVIDRRDVFTRQLDDALLAGEIDLAVHSLKDVPTDLPEGIVLAAITERHDPRDVLVSDAGFAVDELPEGSVVATSSLRRRAQLLHRRHDLEIVEIRGNVDTRVRKMREGAADALVLARAGLERLGLDVAHAVIPSEILLPAVGQGALAVATREDHPLRDQIRDALNHEPTEVAIRAERTMLNTLEGGCRVPVGALGRIVDDNEVWLQGLVASTDGALVYSGEAVGGKPEEVGERLARELLDRGAAVILDEVKEVRR